MNSDGQTIEMANETFHLDSFAVTVRDIADADLKALHALSLSVGWSHRSEDWEFMREVGRGLVALDESGRVHGSAMWFPFGSEFATVGMVIVTPLLQKHGGGQRLMRHVLEHTKGRVLGLHATTQSHQLFLSLGFVDEGTVYLRQGHAGAPPEVSPAPDAELREFSQTDLQAIQTLDRLATTEDRGDLIRALATRSRGMTLRRNGGLEACALIRPFGRGSVIGPVIAGSEDDAIRVLRPLVAVAAQYGNFVRVDVGDAKGRLAEFTEQCGLTVSETVTRMSRGKPWPFSTGATPSIYALASHATG
jgi:GNAT superfamily N-acetyltransferase